MCQLLTFSPLPDFELDIVCSCNPPLFPKRSSGWIGQLELEGSTVERVLGNAGVDTSALRHGEIHDDTSYGRVLLGPGHHRVGLGPLERMGLDRADDGCVLYLFIDVG